MNNLEKLSAALFILALLGLALAGCGSPTKTPTTTESTTVPATPEPDYASAIADTTLKGLSDDNLEEYTRYGDAGFKAAVTQQLLDTTSAQIKSQLGDYESKVYLSTETRDSYTIVHYRAKYSQGEVGVRMVFDTDHLVAGQFFEQAPAATGSS